MSRSAQNLDRFLTAIHRRVTLLRILERAGLGILFASVLGIVILPILLWRSDPTLARPLVAYAKDYQYERILSVLRGEPGDDENAGGLADAAAQ